jgi:simple sugar transport system permease protein
MITTDDRPAPEPVEAPSAGQNGPGARGARFIAQKVAARRPTKAGMRRLGWWVLAYLSALVIFGAFVELHHVNAFSLYGAMWSETITNSYGFGQVLDRVGPFVLAGMAVAVPARAGIINIGGEGQLVIGATAAGGVALALGTHVTGFPALVLMALAGASAGAAWAAIAGLLKVYGNVNEAISTLLLNYVGADVLSYLVYGPWKSAAGNGQPASSPIPAGDFLPTIHAIQAHIGIVIAVVVTIGVAFALKYTRWGFSLRAVGGNPASAKRAGLPVVWLTLSAMLVGGALAGLGGMVQFSGLEGQLRPGLAATFGYTGFLASWLARHEPKRVLLAALLLAVISVAGDALQISSNLPGGAVNILMAVVLLVVLVKRPAPVDAA